MYTNTLVFLQKLIYDYFTRNFCYYIDLLDGLTVNGFVRIWLHIIISTYYSLSFPIVYLSFGFFHDFQNILTENILKNVWRIRLVKINKDAILI